MIRRASSRATDNARHWLGAAVLAGGLWLTVPVAADVSAQPTLDSYMVTPRRMVASGAAIAGLSAAVIGAVALARSSDRIGTRNRRRGAIAALVLGPIGLVIGGLIVATADGGLGTGNGLAGGVVAMMVGLVGMALGGLALSRSRRIA
jgi:cytochrome bd-type quinol oxidase subunit 2